MIELEWSSNVAYAVGLLTTDGCLSKDKRHIDFTSKDIEQIENLKACLGLQTKISWKSSGIPEKLYPRIQFSNVKLYRWLEKIGLHQNKSKTIGQLDIPDKYFFDFLRGHIDGDGSFYSYWDRRWKSSFMYYLQFVSASYEHLSWINEKLFQLIGIKAKIKLSARTYQLVFAKKTTDRIVAEMYKDRNCVALSRKRDKIFTAIMGRWRNR